MHLLLPRIIMKNITFTALCLASSVVSAQATNKGTLSVTVNGAQSNKGTIEIHVIANKAQFDNEIPASLICRKEIAVTKARCDFKDVLHGKYSIFTFHDENLNRTIDFDMLGQPSERLSMSGIDLSQNNSPTFEQSQFDFSSQHAQIFLQLQ